MLNYHSNKIMHSLFATVGAHRGITNEIRGTIATTGAFPDGHKSSGPTALVNSLISDWTSNENWTQLSLVYGLTAYVSCLDKTWRSKFYSLQQVSESSDPGEEKPKGNKKEKSEEQSKFWADLWEAWWGALFAERELWKESTEDLELTLEFLIKRKYAPLIFELSSGFPKFDLQFGLISWKTKRHLLSKGESRVDSRKYSQNDVRLEEITDDDLILNNTDFYVENDHDTIMEKKNNKTSIFLGHRAFIPDTEFSAFDYTSPGRAIECVLLQANAWHDNMRAISTPMQSIQSLSLRQSRQNLEIPPMIERVREAGYIRQEIWKILIRKTHETSRNAHDDFIHALPQGNINEIHSNLMKLMDLLCRQDLVQFSLDSENWKSIMVLVWAKVFSNILQSSTVVLFE